MCSRDRGVRNPRTGFLLVCAVCLACLTLLAAPAQAQTPIAYGETLSGSLAVVGELDIYTFSGSSGEVIHIRLAELTNPIEPRIRLRRPSGFEIGDTWSYTVAELGELTLPTTGSYSIVVSDLGDDETGDYNLHLQRVSDPAGATVMDFGTTVSGTLSMIAETVAYRFAASAGDRILARMTQVTSTLSPALRLYAPDGTGLVQQSGTPTAELNAFEMPSSGTYTLIALESPGTAVGDYRLHLQRLNDPSNAVAIAYGETHAGSLTQLSETKAYRLDATAGDRVLARLCETTTAIEPVVRIYDANGDPLASNWSYTTAALDAVELTETASYTVLALEQSSDETGGFALHVQRTHVPAGATALSWGGTVGASIVDAPETVAYTFAADAGDRILLRMARDATTLAPRLKVYDPSGAPLVGQSGTPIAEIDALQIPSTGTYAVLALDASGTGSGAFLVHAQRLNDPGSSVAIAYGETHAGSLSQLSETKAYRLDATAGDRVLARLCETTTAIEPVVRIYDANGDPLASNWSYTTAALDAVELTETASYTVLALEQSSDETGGFALHVQRTHGPAGATALNWGETVGESIVDAPETVAYTFAADAGDRILLRMARDATTLAPRLKVYDPSGAPLVGQSGTPIAEIDALQIPSTGTYVVLAIDAAGTGHGAFLLHAQRLNDPGLSTSMVYGETVAGSLPQLATTRAYRFSAMAGDRALLRLAEETPEIEPVLRLYDTTGQPITSTWSYTTAALNAVELPSTGDYTVIATEQASDETGDFVLHLQCTNEPAGIVDIAFGETTTGALTLRAETAPYRITASAGDRILVRMTRASEAMGPHLGLYAPNGEVVGSWTGTPTVEGDAVLLNEAGQYSLFAMDSAGVYFGPYALHVQRLNDPGDAVSIGFGESRTDALTQLAETRAFRFSASLGDSVRMFATEITTEIEPVVRLYDPSGVLLASNWSYTVAGLARRLQESGTHTILVLDQASDETGDFRLELLDVATSVSDPLPSILNYQLFEPRPNPFNPSTVLAFDLPRRGHVVLDVYALSGRRVARIVDEAYPAGRHEVIWRGEDSQGRGLASGTYIYELRSGEYRAARKVTLVQ